MVEWEVWLIVAATLAIAEIATTGFFVLWFAAGAAVAAAAAALGVGIVGQLLVFLAVSGFLVVFTRPLVHRLVEKRRPAFRTNVDALVGKVGTVVRKVDPLDVSGQVKVQGEVWTAVTRGGPIPRGAMVVVERVDGVKLHVRPVEDRPETARSEAGRI